MIENANYGKGQPDEKYETWCFSLPFSFPIHVLQFLQMNSKDQFISERELMFMFAIFHRP